MRFHKQHLETNVIILSGLIFISSIWCAVDFHSDNLLHDDCPVCHLNLSLNIFPDVSIDVPYQCEKASIEVCFVYVSIVTCLKFYKLNYSSQAPPA